MKLKFKLVTSTLYGIKLVLLYDLKYLRLLNKTETKVAAEVWLNLSLPAIHRVLITFATKLALFDKRIKDVFTFLL